MGGSYSGDAGSGSVFFLPTELHNFRHQCPRCCFDQRKQNQFPPAQHGNALYYAPGQGGTRKKQASIYVPIPFSCPFPPPQYAPAYLRGREALFALR